MKYISTLTFAFTILIFPHFVSAQGEANTDIGAVIVAASEGEVTVYENGDQAQGAKPELGQVIPVGKFIATAQGAKLTLLLSNGTLVTLEESTKMQVGKFEQAPFDGAGKTVSDLEGEPSTSEVELELGMGSLIIKTKKLKKGSSFNINSPVGTAGIRGTEFALAIDPAGGGVQLDVTESTVAFTPPGGQPLPVTQGQGLDISATGQMAPRPVNPVVAQTINVTNTTATEITADIPLDAVADAIVESKEVSEPAPATEDEPANEESDEPMVEEPDEPDSTEPEDAEPAEQPEDRDERSAELKEEQQDRMDEQQEAREERRDEFAERQEELRDELAERQEEMRERQEEIREEFTERQNELGEKLPGTEEPREVPGSRRENLIAVVEENLRDTTQLTKEIKIDEFIEQNPDAKQFRETGKMGAPASELSKLSLNREELGKFREFPEELQKALVGAESIVVDRLLTLEGFTPELVAKFTDYSPRARDLILGLEDIALITLLEQGIDEELIMAALSPESIALSSSSNIPTESAAGVMDENVLSLGDSLRESGNTEIYNEVLELSGGELTEDWVRIAEVANSLSAELYIEEGMLPAVSDFSGREALANPFYEEISSLYDVLELDLMVAGDNPSIIGADSISVYGGTYDLYESIGTADSLIISASESFNVSGNIQLTNSGPSGRRVVIMSGDTISPREGSTVTSALSDLVVATRGDVLLKGSQLESAREVAIRSLRDIKLEQTSLLSNSLVYVKATQDLDVDGLELSQSLPNLIMEATTIRLSNVDFPSATQVQLNSLKGAIDGRYPNFGTSIPVTEQLGRVNFIENVKSGGNLLMDRAAFDQYGANINIGKLP